MLAFIIALIWYLLVSNPFQSPVLSGKQAVAMVQGVQVSKLDAEFGSDPFTDWFRQLVGPEAGVTWQLNECGEHPSILAAQGRELPACVETQALLPDGRKVIVVIAVGTFKKGLSGKPDFLYAVIEQEGILYSVRRLRDLPEGLRSPGSIQDMYAVKLIAAGVLPPGVGRGLVTTRMDAPPPPPNWKVSEGVIHGDVITRVMPLYPAGAKKFNASGKVEVRVIISETGSIIEATAISGHPLLYRAAEDAALKWVFNPSTVNGVPVRAESVLTFVFTPGR